MRKGILWYPFRTYCGLELPKFVWCPFMLRDAIYKSSEIWIWITFLSKLNLSWIQMNMKCFHHYKSVNVRVSENTMHEICHYEFLDAVDCMRLVMVTSIDCIVRTSSLVNLFMLQLLTLQTVQQNSACCTFAELWCQKYN